MAFTIQIYQKARKPFGAASSIESYCGTIIQRILLLLLHLRRSRGALGKALGGQMRIFFTLNVEMIGKFIPKSFSFYLCPISSPRSWKIIHMTAIAPYFSPFTLNFSHKCSTSPYYGSRVVVRNREGAFTSFSLSHTEQIIGMEAELIVFGSIELIYGMYCESTT